MRNKIDVAAEALLEWVGEEDLSDNGIQRYRHAVCLVLEKLDLRGETDSFDKVQHMQQQLDASETKVVELQNQLRRFRGYNLTTATAVEDWYERGKRRMDAIVERLNNPAP